MGLSLENPTLTPLHPLIKHIPVSLNAGFHGTLIIREEDFNSGIVENTHDTFPPNPLMENAGSI
jgi:hypothetical protein